MPSSARCAADFASASVGSIPDRLASAATQTAHPQSPLSRRGQTSQPFATPTSIAETLARPTALANDRCAACRTVLSLAVRPRLAADCASGGGRSLSPGVPKGPARRAPAAAAMQRGRRPSRGGRSPCCACRGAVAAGTRRRPPVGEEQGDVNLRLPDGVPSFAGSRGVRAAPGFARIARTCQSVVLARSLLTIRREQRCTPVSSCLLERTTRDSAGADCRILAMRKNGGWPVVVDQP